MRLVLILTFGVILVKYCCANFSPFYHVENTKECSITKPLSVVLNEAKEKQDAIPAIFEFYRGFPKVLVLNSTRVSRGCQLQNAKFLRALQNHDFFATKMFDASAKIPSGILSGNVNQYGDFDECLSLDGAQYCLAEIDPRPSWKEPFLKFKSLVHSHFNIKEEFSDPKHRVPGFTMIRWGFCLPKQCSNDDLKVHLEDILGVNASIPASMCQNSQKREDFTTGHYIARIFFFLLFTTVTLSTVLTLYKNSLYSNQSNSKLMRCLLAFSLQDNWKKLVTTKDNANKDIGAVHGIRALSALGLIMSHKAMAMFYNPYVNRTQMIEHYGLPWSVIGRTAIIYTDSFIFISGLLTANAMFSDLLKGKGINFRDKLITRIFRITPTLLTVILFCTYILPTLGSGPIWPIVVDHHATLCKQYMWRNLLYVHNYFGFENMCLTHTHQVGIDMQLFLSSPLFVYLMWMNRKIGARVLFAAAALSTVLRLWVSWASNLSHMVHFGITVSRMFDTANLSYILPTHRATVYLMGVYLAYVLKASNNDILRSKFYVRCFWTVSVSLGFVALLGPFHMARKAYVYDVTDGALYGTISPILWGIAIGWTIYATNNGYGGWFGSLLSWRGFELFTKISYAVYLVQFPVFFYNVGITRSVGEYKPRMLMEIPETMVIILVSIFLTLMVEMPFQSVKRILFESSKQVGQLRDTTTGLNKRRG